MHAYPYRRRVRLILALSLVWPVAAFVAFPLAVLPTIWLDSFLPVVVVFLVAIAGMYSAWFVRCPRCGKAFAGGFEGMDRARDIRLRDLRKPISFEIRCLHCGVRALVSE